MSEIYGTVISASIFKTLFVSIIKHLFYSLLSYMSDSQLGATHLVSDQLKYDSSS